MGMFWGFLGKLMNTPNLSKINKATFTKLQKTCFCLNGFTDKMDVINH